MKKSTIFAVVIALVLLGGAVLLGGRQGAQSPNTVAYSNEQASAELTATMTTNPLNIEAGTQTELAFIIKETNGNVPELMKHHARILHVLIIGEDMSTIAHLHPEDFGDIASMKKKGIFSVDFTFPKAGKYLVAIDAMDSSGEYAQQFPVLVSGTEKLTGAVPNTTKQKCFAGYQEEGHDKYTQPTYVPETGVPCSNDTYQVTLSHDGDSLESGLSTSLRFNISKNGEPITNMEPYLDTAFHLAIVPDDLSGLIHGHGSPTGADHHATSLIPVAHAQGKTEDGHHHETSLPSSFGPDLTSEPIIFPKEGGYHIFAQFKHEEKIVFAKFAVMIEKGISAEQFQFLSNQMSNSCGGGKTAVYGLPESGRMQGSCCGPMDMHSYKEQVAGLKAKYSEYNIIPPDPYDVSVVWAREMIEYNDKTKLTTEQQAIYDKAVTVSKEGGPCCCVCWHWYAYAGLAKQLIIKENFTSEQVAEVWDLSDACGGDHHHH